MTRTTIMLPERLKGRAQHFAQQKGISLGQLIRESLEAVLADERTLGRREDPLFADVGLYQGDTPNDLSRRHDEYLYGAGE